MTIVTSLINSAHLLIIRQVYSEILSGFNQKTDDLSVFFLWNIF